MKSIIYLLLLLMFLSCKDSIKKDIQTSKNNNSKEMFDTPQNDWEERMEKSDIEYSKFDAKINDYYNQINSNPKTVIIQTEKLIKEIENEADSNNLKRNKLGLLYSLRAETFYKLGKYKQSINEIYKDEKNTQLRFGGDFSFGTTNCIHLACNYVKLRDYEKAQLYLDSTSIYYIIDYVKANFIEVTGNKGKAIEAYLAIKNNKSIDHYHYYQFALKRIEELSKPEPILLNELFYPSLRSDKEICLTDNTTRTKIIDLISALPEIKKLDQPYTIYVYQEPKETKSSNYWIKVNLKYDFLVDTSSFRITYFDKKNNKKISLSEWRK